MPSRPILQACANTSGPSSSSRCSLKRKPGRRAPEQAGKRRLAHRERITPHVLTIELDQVEGIEEHARIVPPIADAVEARDPVLAARHRLAVDDAGARAQLGERLDDEREAVGQVIARPAVELHPLVVLAGDDPKAVVLDFVQPVVAGRRLRGDVGRQGAMKPAGRVRGRNDMGGCSAGNNSNIGQPIIISAFLRSVETKANVGSPRPCGVPS